MPFSRPSLESLIARTSSEVSARLEIGPLLQRSILDALARVTAGQSHLLHAHLEYVAGQVFPDTADADNLERWASIFGIQRKAPGKSVGSVDFTGTDGSVIPLGTLLRRTDAVEFVTTIEVTIVSGVASTTVEAVDGGDAGDTAATTQLTIASPIVGVTSTAIVDSAGLTGGADQESDADLLGRLLQRLQTPPQGGSVADYEAWTLEVPEVTRAFALPEHFGPGTVGVTFLVDEEDDPIPSASKVEEVQDYIDDPTRRPVTASVTVFAPGVVNLDPFISLTPDTSVVRDSVTKSLEAMLLDISAPGANIPVSKVTEAISTAPGEEDHVLTSPIPSVLPGAMMFLGTITWV